MWKLFVFVAGMAAAFMIDLAMQPVAERIYWRRFERESAGRVFDGAHGCYIPVAPN